MLATGKPKTSVNIRKDLLKKGVQLFRVVTPSEKWFGFLSL